jgi:hypothetical protein
LTAIVENLREGACPIFLARGATDPNSEPPEDLVSWFRDKWIDWVQTGRAKGIICRSVSLDRLPYVLENGIDVPLGEPLWAEIGLSKAWEYGGSHKLLMVLNKEALTPSYVVLPLDTPEEQLEYHKRQYPNVERREREIYLSRLPLEKVPYGDYAYFPAGDPRACLVALIIVLPPEEQIPDWIVDLLDRDEAL